MSTPPTMPTSPSPSPPPPPQMSTPPTMPTTPLPSPPAPPQTSTQPTMLTPTTTSQIELGFGTIDVGSGTGVTSEILQPTPEASQTTSESNTIPPIQSPTDALPGSTPRPSTDAPGGLSERDIVIISVSVGAGGLVLLAILIFLLCICVCLCLRSRRKRVRLYYTTDQIEEELAARGPNFVGARNQSFHENGSQDFVYKNPGAEDTA